ncbi:conserved protein of unknown function [Methylacidimicrobium sp. AP8]|nr:conserved protein of unknown function [Methylacidimicrobium sp. AP8]
MIPSTQRCQTGGRRCRVSPAPVYGRKPSPPRHRIKNGPGLAAATLTVLLLLHPPAVESRRAAMTPFVTERLAHFLNTLPEGKQLFVRSYLAFDCTHDLVGPSACGNCNYFFVVERGNERRGNLLFRISGNDVRFLRYFSFSAPYAELPCIGLSEEEALCVALLWAEHEISSQGRETLQATIANRQFPLAPLQKTAYRLLGLSCP